MKVRTLRVISDSRLGFRGAILLILGVADLLYGWSLISPAAEASQTPINQWRAEILPSAAWGMLWITIGCVLLIHAFMRRDDVGYVLAIAIKAVWTMVSFGAWVVGGVESGWSTALVWAAFAAMIAVISGWPEPFRLEEITVVEDGEPGNGDEP